MEDGNFRLSPRFLESCPVTSPPTNQKKVTRPAALNPNFPYKNFSQKPIKEFRFFEHKPPVLLAWPCNKAFSAPNLEQRKVLVCLASVCIGHTNLCLVTVQRISVRFILVLFTSSTFIQYFFPFQGCGVFLCLKTALCVYRFSVDELLVASSSWQ